jgi:hypothetical protein
MLVSRADPQCARRRLNFDLGFARGPFRGGNSTVTNDLTKQYRSLRPTLMAQALEAQLYVPSTPRPTLPLPCRGFGSAGGPAQPPFGIWKVIFLPCQLNALVEHGKVD